MIQSQIDFNLERLDEWKDKFSFPLTRKQACELLLDDRQWDKELKKYTKLDRRELYTSVNFAEVIELLYYGEIK